MDRIWSDVFIDKGGDLTTMDKSLCVGRNTLQWEPIVKCTSVSLDYWNDPFDSIRRK